MAGQYAEAATRHVHRNAAVGDCEVGCAKPGSDRKRRPCRYERGLRRCDVQRRRVAMEYLIDTHCAVVQLEEDCVGGAFGWIEMEAAHLHLGTALKRQGQVRGDCDD